MSTTETQSPKTAPTSLAGRLSALIQLWQDREANQDDGYVEQAVRGAVCQCRKELQKAFAGWRGEICGGTRVAADEPMSGTGMEGRAE